MRQPGVMPGECWAFQGSQGTAVIKLINQIYVTGISLEHIPRSISPSGEISTAPKEFSVWVNNSFIFKRFDILQLTKLSFSNNTY